MKQIKTPQDIVELGTILSVWAHPDDETFTAGGLLYLASKNHQKVICVTATKGEDGIQDPKWSDGDLGSIREQEMHKAAEIIGIHEHHWLGYHDGLCENADKLEASKKVAKLIAQYRPDTILTFGKDGITGHSDHCCVSCWVDDAVEGIDTKPVIYHAVHTRGQFDNYLIEMDRQLNIFFNTDDPPIKPDAECDICVALPEVALNAKLQALESMTSQTERMFELFDKKYLKKAFITEAFVRPK